MGNNADNLFNVNDKKEHKYDMNLSIITSIITDAIKELNLILAPEDQIVIDSETILYGKNGVLDSMGIINLTVIVEEMIYEKFNVDIALSEYISSSDMSEIFKNIETLSARILALVENKQK
ncbi:MAG: hypothetical protein WDA26_09585 [Pusillimonas sp.]